MTRVLLAISILCVSPVYAFDRIENILGDGSDPIHASYVLKRCGVISATMAENFSARGNADETPIVELLKKRAYMFISAGRSIELDNSKGVSEEEHRNQLSLIGKMYVTEMEGHWSKTGHKISENIVSDLAACTELYKMFEE